MDGVTPQDVAANLAAVQARIAARRPNGPPATLIAVSKTKPVELLRGAYDSGQRDFGENYVQEVTAKGPAMPDDVRFHFIGHLQTNKVKEIVAVPNLHCVHTVDSLKLAAELQKRAAGSQQEAERIRGVGLEELVAFATRHFAPQRARRLSVLVFGSAHATPEAIGAACAPREGTVLLSDPREDAAAARARLDAFKGGLEVLRAPCEEGGCRV